MRNYYVLFDGTTNKNRFYPESEGKKWDPEWLEGKVGVNKKQLKEIYESGEYQQSNVGKVKDFVCIRSGDEDGDFKFLKYHVQKLQSGTLFEFMVTANENGDEDVILYYEGVASQQDGDAADLLSGWSGRSIIEHAFQYISNLIHYEEGGRQHFCQKDKPDDLGDKFVVMGFSRGAVQARLFCYMLDVAGGFLPGYDGIAELFSCLKGVLPSWVSRTLDKKSDWLKAQLKAQGLRPRKARVDFLGVYDSVIGTTRGNGEYDGRGWIAQRVSSFLATFYGGVRPLVSHRLLTELVPTCCKRVAHALSIYEHRVDFQAVRFSSRHGVKEVWFPGYHSDVGGGNIKPRCNTISNFTLCWILHELYAATGIVVAEAEMYLLKPEEEQDKTKVDPMDRCYRKHAHPHVDKLAEQPARLQLWKRGRPVPQDACISSLAFCPAFREDSHPHLKHLKAFSIAESALEDPLYYEENAICRKWGDAIDLVDSKFGGVAHASAGQEDLSETEKLLASLCNAIDDMQLTAARVSEVQQEINDTNKDKEAIELIIEAAKEQNFSEEERELLPDEEDVEAAQRRMHTLTEQKETLLEELSQMTSAFNCLSNIGSVSQNGKKSAADAIAQLKDLQQCQELKSSEHLQHRFNENVNTLSQLCAEEP
eukprot:TRINITY_DN66769_c5_g1_i1.p1 TRINITY_DN66769_c5_g1~~TRINITY_DN66769_c5_g1_i1.p1  ORF type:complete len:650 (+),score=75.47 TRINITY_DN66769_c5_g1_i1:513-2462(+)